MKKLLILVLSLILMLSLTMPSVFAETDAELDAEEMEATEHAVPVFGCNETLGAWKRQDGDQIEGSACLTRIISRNQTDGTKIPVVDATGMDTLEFWMYVSDVSLFEMFAKSEEGMNSGLELSSAGEYDKEEIAWKLTGIWNYNRGDEIVDGEWCHIILPISTADKTGEIDLSRVNYFRIFMVGEKADPGILVKIDNFVLTDYEAQKEAQDKAAAQSVVDEMNALKGLTIEKENYATVKMQIETARAHYDALPDGPKTSIALSIVKVLRDAEKALKAYEEEHANDETETEPESETDAVPQESESVTPEETKAEENKSGCSSVIGMSSLIVLGMISLAVPAVIRKKD
ncbi:MAG: hypothetical protein IJT60_03305 [Clostridia bacterium]|nr:hypothetical protein [Clostridia bacterium]